MKIFLKNKRIIFGNSCSGKTFFYKKLIIKKKIDLDFFLLYKNCLFNNEIVFRNFEKKCVNFFVKSKILNHFIGGGCISSCLFYNKCLFLIKNVSYLNFLKRLLNDNNRPLLKNIKKIKLLYTFRKKKYLKIPKIYLNKCYFCNLKIYENNKV